MAFKEKYLTLKKEIECLRSVAAVDASILPKYLAYGQLGNSWVLVSEQCANCEHASFTKCIKTTFNPRSFVNRLLYILSVLDGAGVVHGDLKVSNLLVTASGNIVVTDFSGSAVGTRNASTNLEKFEGVTVRANHITCFTEDFHAPELLEGCSTVNNVDMYSAGKILEEVYGEDYWTTDQDCMHAL